MATRKTGGSFAITGFVYQFLNTVDQGLSASLDRKSGNDLILVLEPAGADAARHGAAPQVIQYKSRSSGDWSPHAVLFEILPPLLEAALGAPEAGYAPVFVTSAPVRNGVAVRSLLAALGAKLPGTPLKVGRTVMTAEAIFDEIARRTAALHGAVGNSAFRTSLRILLAKIRIDDRVKSTAVQQRVKRQLLRLTGSRQRAERAYQALFTFVAERSQQPVATISVREFLEAAGLTAKRLAPILAFERRIADITGSALERRGYAKHRDVRRPLDVPEARLVLVEGSSGSGKSWSLAALAARELSQGRPALWIDEIENLEAFECEAIRQLWHLALRRGEQEGTSLATLTADVADVLAREERAPLLVVLDRLPRSPAERDRLLGFDWAGAGIRLVAAATPVEAADVQERMAAPVLNVGDFSQAELRALLGGSGIAWASLPGDVRTWIKRPVLAGLFVSLAAETGDWRASSEYELMDRFAWRARVRGEAGDIPGCRAAIAQLGGDALAHGSPLDPARLAQPPAAHQLRSLVEAGWLQRDANGDLKFSHDRLRDWAIAEHLVRDAADATALAAQLTHIAGYGKSGTPLPAVRAGYALMDGIWLVSQSDDGARKLNRLLTALDEGEHDWPFVDDLYGDLLPTGGAALLDMLLPTLKGRLEQGSDSAGYYHARLCLEGFAEAGPVSDEAIASLLYAADWEAQRQGCRIVERQPDPRHLDRLDVIHGRASAAAEGGEEALRRAAWSAIRACLMKRPGWLAARFARAEPDFHDVSHLVSLLPKVQEGEGIWDRLGRALVAALTDDPVARFWLARCIVAFEDRRFDDLLVQWSMDSRGMASVRAWPELCRHRPDLAAAVARKAPAWLFSTNVHDWLQPLIKPGAREALRAVIDSLKSEDPSGCRFGFALAASPNELDDEDVAWAAERLDAALAAPEPRDLTASRLLDFFAAIDDPLLIDRLGQVIPPSLPDRLQHLVDARLKGAGLWHDPELAGATSLLQKLGGSHAASAMRAHLRNAHPTIRWNAVREAAFADIDLIRDELEAIAAADDRKEEPGRLDAVRLLAEQDPDWGRRHIRRKLAEATTDGRNEAFWLAIRMPGDEFVPEARALLAETFAGRPLYRPVEYLIARGAVPEEVSRALCMALPDRKDDKGWIADCLLALGLDSADQAVADRMLPNADSINRAELIFWFLANRQDTSRWRPLAEALIGSVDMRTLRHARNFYEAAARLGCGPAYDQLLSDAYPAKPEEWNRALAAINALGKQDEAGAAEALTRLCALQDIQDRDLEKFATAVGRVSFPGAQRAILRGAADWPADALLRALRRPRDGFDPALAATIRNGLRSPDPAARRTAAACAPLVLDMAPQDLCDDRVEEVREAARDAVRFHAQRERVKALLAEMAQAAPDRSRRAAAALFSIAERERPRQTPLAFSWSEFAAAAPRRSGFRFAIPT